jgi:hypothetical protein
MKRSPLVLFVAVALAGFAHGQNTLDWSAPSWGLGTTGTSTYNDLSGAGSASAAIKTLVYDFGGGLTATVSASLGGTTQWQTSTAIFGGNGYAPRVSDAGVFAFGINNGSATTGGSLTVTFNHTVTLDSFTIGDIDNGGMTDHVNVQADSGPLSVISTPAVAPAYSVVGDTLSFTGISANEGTFNPGAATAWAELSSGSTGINSLTVSLLNGTGNHGIWFSDLNVTVIPEPSAYALLLACGTLILLAVRFRLAGRL